MKTLRALFLARPSREKFLILILLVAVVVIWCNSLIGRLQAFSTQAHNTTTQLRTQAMWIGRKDRIEKQAQAEAAALDPSQTLDALRLNSTVSSIAQAAGLSGYNISPGQDTAPENNFAFHTVYFTINKVSWDAIENFYYRIQQRAPYLGIDTFSLMVDRSSKGALLNANLSISSVEILHGGE